MKINHYKSEELLTLRRDVMRPGMIDFSDVKYEKNVQISSLEANFENLEKRQKSLKSEITEIIILSVTE